MPKPNIANPDSVFAARLRTLMDERESGKVTQAELAEAIGAVRQAVSQYRNGEIAPNMDKVCAIADYFDVSTDYLMGRTDVRSKHADVSAICNATGLSDDAVNALVRLQNLSTGRSLTGKKRKFWGSQKDRQFTLYDNTLLLETINYLLEMEGGTSPGLLALISTYTNTRFESLDESAADRFELKDADTGNVYDFMCKEVNDMYLLWVQSWLKDMRTNAAGSICERAKQKNTAIWAEADNTTIQKGD